MHHLGPAPKLERRVLMPVSTVGAAAVSLRLTSLSADQRSPPRFLSQVLILPEPEVADPALTERIRQHFMEPLDQRIDTDRLGILS